MKRTRFLLLPALAILIPLVGLFGQVGEHLGQARAASRHEELHYYGANLQDVARATGVSLDGTVDPNGPWPQFAQNYCFVAVVQALVNYDDITRELPLRYPHQSDQGPASGNPNDEQVGQILWDMDHLMIPPSSLSERTKVWGRALIVSPISATRWGVGRLRMPTTRPKGRRKNGGLPSLRQTASGPLVPKGSAALRRPFTLGNIAYDFRGDPRIQAFATNYEAPVGEMKYHEHIYHTDAQDATVSMAKALARYRRPVLVLANHAEHTLLVAGFWATGNPLTTPRAQIRSLAVFNPWNSAAWGQYITTGPYQQVSLDDWLNATDLPTPFGGITTMLNLPYASNGTLDPDPFIGIYQAGPGTKNPNQHHWIGNFVIIEPDWHWQSANFSFDENNKLMLQP